MRAANAWVCGRRCSTLSWTPVAKTFRSKPPSKGCGVDSRESSSRSHAASASAAPCPAPARPGGPPSHGGNLAGSTGPSVSSSSSSSRWVGRGSMSAAILRRAAHAAPVDALTCASPWFLLRTDDNASSRREVWRIVTTPPGDAHVCRRPTGEAYVQLLAAKHERRLLGKQPVGAHSGLQLGMRRAPTASVTRSSAAQLRAEPRELIRVERTARLSGACAAGRALSRAVGLPLV